MENTSATWEQSVLWLRSQSERRALVEACYYDDPLISAAIRFYRNEEWTATKAILARRLPGDVLDLGAGRGMASYAFAKEGCIVSALEPDASFIVGRGAIERLAQESELPIRAVEGVGEAIPFADESFDIVYGRAVLHHARDLPALCRETARVLRPGGLFLAVREHVISQQADLQEFLDSHPLHKLYGGENAFTLEEYESAITQAGLKIRRSIGPWENAVNFWPDSYSRIQAEVLTALASRVTRPAAWILMKSPMRHQLISAVSRRLKTPGRHYAFLSVKSG